MQENSFKLKGFIVWGICALFFLYEFFLRTVIGSYQTPLMNDLNLSALEFSILSSTLFLLVYGFMQIPVGIIIDNIGLKKSLIIGCSTCILACLIFSYSSNYLTSLSARSLMGFGASFGFICLLIAVQDWMPSKYNALFIGLSQFIGTIGPMLAAGPLESLSETSNINWRQIFFILSIIGAAILILIIVFVQNKQKTEGKHIILSRPEAASTAITKLFTRKEPWIIAFLSALLYFTIEYFSENEGRNFIVSKKLDNSYASYMITVSWLGYAFGAPVLGLISDFIRRRKIMLISGALVGIVAILIILYSDDKTYLIFGFFLLGISGSSQTIGFAIMAEQFKKKFVAIGFGLNNAILNGMAAINAPIIGYFLDCRKCDGTIELQDYTYIFSFFILIPIMALILSSFFLKETYCKSSVDFTYLNIK